MIFLADGGFPLEKFVVFELDDQKYGVHIHYVSSVVKLAEISYKPLTKNFIKGIIQIREKLVPIIDLKIYFSVGQTKLMDQTKILFVTIKDTEIGLLVDSTMDVIDLYEPTLD